MRDALLAVLDQIPDFGQIPAILAWGEGGGEGGEYSDEGERKSLAVSRGYPVVFRRGFCSIIVMIVMIFGQIEE